MEKDTNFITMVDRAMKIIDYIYACSKPIGVSQLSVDLDLPKATVFRLLHTLEKWDAVQQVEGSGKYILGKAHIKYGSKAKENFDLVSIADPIMDELALDIGETVNLGVRYQDNVLIVHNKDGESSILVSKLIPITPLYCSSIGKLFLATLDDGQLKDYFTSTSIEKRTIHTSTSLDAFTKERQEILDKDVAYDNEEYEYGLTCLASPIYDKHGKITAALSISGPTSRIKFKGLAQIESKLKEATATISQSLNEI